MITGFLLQIIYAFLNFLVGLLPAGATFPPSWLAAVNTIWGYINSFSFIIPVDVMLYCLGVAFTFHLFVFAWKALHWIYGLIRGTKMH